MSSRWSNDAIALDTETDDAATIVIGGVTEMGESLNTVINAPETGAPFTELPTVGGVLPVETFATEQIEVIVDQIGLSGKVIDSGTGNPGFTRYMARHDAAGPNGRAAGSVHHSTTYGDGHIFIESITANAGQNMTARLQIHALSSDGEASPIARAWNVALPTWPTDDAYSLAGILVGGNLLETVLSVTINYNVQFVKPITGSFRYPVLFDVVKIAPTITIQFDDPQEILDTIVAAAVQVTEIGKKIDSSNYNLQFRRVLQPLVTGPFAKASSEHLTLDVNGFIHTPTPTGASGSAASNTTVEIICEENAAGVPLIWTKDQTIT